MNRNMTYAELNQTRRSRRAYTGKLVTREMFTEIVEEASLAPNASNLQPWRIMIAQGVAIERFLPALTGDNPVKIKSAQSMVIVFGDPNAVESSEGARKWYDAGYTTRHDFAIRDASLFAMNFMLAAWSRGIATRPMIGFDPCLLKQAAGAPLHLVPALIMAAGYPDAGEEIRPRSRKPAKDILTFLE